MPPVMHFVCHNEDCVWVNQVRAVQMVSLGNGVLARPIVSCECTPEIELRRVHPDGEPYVIPIEQLLAQAR